MLPAEGLSGVYFMIATGKELRSTSLNVSLPVLVVHVCFAVISGNRALSLFTLMLPRFSSLLAHFENADISIAHCHK